MLDRLAIIRGLPKTIRTDNGLVQLTIDHCAGRPGVATDRAEEDVRTVLEADQADLITPMLNELHVKAGSFAGDDKFNG